MTITRFGASAVGKIYRLRTEKLRELEARGVTSTSFVTSTSYVATGLEN